MQCCNKITLLTNYVVAIIENCVKKMKLPQVLERYAGLHIDAKT